MTFTFQDRSLSNHFCCCRWVFFHFLIGPFDSLSTSLQRPVESVCFSFHILLFPSFFPLQPHSLPFSVSGICRAYFHFKVFALTIPSILLSLSPNTWISHFTSCLRSLSPPPPALSQAPYLKVQPRSSPHLTLLIPRYCSVILLLIYLVSLLTGCQLYRTGISLFSYVLYWLTCPHYLEQCLALNRCSINVCWHELRK